MAQYVLRSKDAEKAQPASASMWAFTIIWIGQIISLLGSGMTCFAQSVWVYTDVGSTITNITALAVLAQLPGVIISPLAGALVDRWDRRWVMIISDTVAAAAAFTLRTLVVTERVQLWHIYVIVIIISIANHFQWPAYFSTISLMVPKKHLDTANGLVQAGRAMGQVAAPFLAGVVVTLFKIQGVILFDMGTYLFALATLLLVRIPKPPLAPVQRTTRRPIFSDIAYGWNYLMSKPGLAGLLTFFGISNFLFGIVGLLLLPLVLSITTPTMLGSMLTVGGVSMLASSLIVAAFGAPKRRIYGVLGFTLLQGVAILMAGLGTSLPLLYVAGIIFYFATPLVSVCGGILWQTKVPPEVQGRALAASAMVSTGATHLAYLIAGPLADHVFEPLLAEGGSLAGSVGRFIGVGTGRGIALMFVLFGALGIVLSIIGFLQPRLRKADTELPDVMIGDTEAELQKNKWSAANAPLFPGDMV